MTPSQPGPPIRTAASTAAGLCYLAVIAGGLFAQVGVRESLVVAGDPAATAAAIADRELLWRIGIAVHLFYLVPALAMKVLVTSFFHDADPLLARLALVFGVAAVTVEAMSLVLLTTPLVVDATDPIAPRLIQTTTQLFTNGFAFSLVLFAGFCVGVGVLILRTRRLPGAIGAMMILAGVCYVVNTGTLLVAPAVHRAINPGVLAPIFLAELALAVWLLAKGVAEVPSERGATPR